MMEAMDTESSQPQTSELPKEGQAVIEAMDTESSQPQTHEAPTRSQHVQPEVMKIGIGQVQTPTEVSHLSKLLGSDGSESNNRMRPARHFSLAKCKNSELRPTKRKF